MYRIYNFSKLNFLHFRVIFLTILFCIVCFSKIYALTVQIDPDPTFIYSIGDVDISINVDDSTPFRGFKLVLNYNDSIIDFISAEQGSLMISHPVGWWIVVEESSNTVRIECIIFGAGLFVQGPGTILTIHFDGLLEGISYLNFEEYEFYDIMGTPIQEVLAENGKIIIGTPICISIKVFLESAYDAENDTMKVSNNNPLPLISPYDDVMEVESIPQNTVDWIYVALRASPTGISLNEKSMFLNSKGEVVDPFFSNPGFFNIDPGNYYIIIQHRNHLAIMSQNSYPVLDSGRLAHAHLYSETNIYGSHGSKELEVGIYGMCTGDPSQDGEITTIDYTIWYNDFINGLSGYQRSDLNSDGEVTTSDYIKWYNNFFIGFSSSVPEQ